MKNEGMKNEGMKNEGVKNYLVLSREMPLHIKRFFATLRYAQNDILSEHPKICTQC